MLHRLSLTPGSGLELPALPESAAAQAVEGPGDSVASIVDSLERLALDAGADQSADGAGSTLSPALDFQEFLQRQDRFLKVSMRSSTSAVSIRCERCSIGAAGSGTGHAFTHIRLTACQAAHACCMPCHRVHRYLHASRRVHSY